MEPNNIKINLNRPELTPEEINANKRFKTVYESVIQRPTYKRFINRKYFGGLLLVLAITAVLVVDRNEEKKQAKQITASVTKVKPLKKNMPNPLSKDITKGQKIVSEQFNKVYATKKSMDSIETSYAYSDFFTENKKPAQYYYLDNNNDTAIHCVQGTDLFFDKQCFINPTTNKSAKKVQLMVKEFYTLTDIVANKLSTMCDNKLLETAGMINVKAYEDNIELRIDSTKPYGVEFANKQMDYTNYQLFSGNKVNDVTEWDLLKEGRTNQINLPKKDIVAIADTSGIRVSIVFDPKDEWTTEKKWNDKKKMYVNVLGSKHTELDKGENINTLYENANINLNEYATIQYKKFILESAKNELWWKRIVKKRKVHLVTIQHNFNVVFKPKQNVLRLVTPNMKKDNRKHEKINAEQEFWSNLLAKELKLEGSSNLLKSKFAVLKITYGNYGNTVKNDALTKINLNDANTFASTLKERVSVKRYSVIQTRDNVNCDKFSDKIPVVNRLTRLSVTKNPTKVYAAIYEKIKSVQIINDVNNFRDFKINDPILLLKIDKKTNVVMFTKLQPSKTLNRVISDKDFKQCSASELQAMFTVIDKQTYNQ